MKYVPVLLLFVCGYAMFASVGCNSMWETIAKSNKNMFEITKKKGRMLDTDSDSTHIVHGDILKDPNFPDPRKARDGRSAGKKLPFFTWHKKLWNTRLIPYEITSSLYKSRAVIVKSLNIIRDKLGGCLKFKRKTRADKWWLSFSVGQGCYSGIGRRYYKEYQATKISLGFGCTIPSIIVHEVMHALGFPHEQSRRDRDSYVKIYKYRIQTRMLDNFRMNEVGDINDMGTPYDYDSIMHYSTKTFAKDPRKGNTIENKYDPNYGLSSLGLSPVDIVELKALYSCETRRGWSKWYGWGGCECSWTGDCYKSSVRICIGTSPCPGANDYGTDSKAKKCTKAERDKFKISKDGHWGNWSPFTKCDSSCGWGYHTRSRKCNNPRPTGYGKSCGSVYRQRLKCRRPRCGGSRFDEHFESSRTNWEMTKFKRMKSSPYGDKGPRSDHTTGRGYFAAYWGQGKGKKNLYAKLTSRIFKSRRTRCLSFHYMLDGQNFNEDGALVVYLKPLNVKSKSAFVIFNKKSHQGNYWRGKTLNIPKRPYTYQFIIMARLAQWRDSVIAIDDIFIDNGKCSDAPVGKTKKTTTKKKTITNSKPKSKSKPSGCKDKSGLSCSFRAKNGQCSSYAAWMSKNCCAACKNKPKKKKSGCTDTSGAKCRERASKGQCSKYAKWMKSNCCASCKSCADKRNFSCSQRAKNGQCTSKYASWMSKNCCASCSRKAG